jgi:hypothetical protein
LNPRYRSRAITLTFDQFKYGWTNALDEDEAKRLYDTYHVAASGIALAQMVNSNLNPWTESKVDTKNPDRGPLLILDGEKDHTVPWAIANASYKRQKRNPSVTEIKKMPNRGHSLTIDHGWQEVAQTALDFVKRFVPAEASRPRSAAEFFTGGTPTNRTPRARLRPPRREAEQATGTTRLRIDLGAFGLRPPALSRPAPRNHLVPGG